jgi:hypothetical protein
LLTTIKAVSIKAAEARNSNPNSDIEESGWPDQAQKILKMIREIKQQITEKRQEIQVLMADQSMSLEVKQTKLGVVQTALSVLSASLMNTDTSLQNHPRMVLGQQRKLSRPNS